jgi:uncharacterized protein (DUF488 family)
MYYRRKVLLALLETFDNRLEKISLQKLLMLVTKLQVKPDYSFVPYKFGCFSFQANADLYTMLKYNQVKVEENFWVKTDSQMYFSSLKESDRQAISYIKLKHGSKNTDELIHYTYIKFPYYAINSIIAKERLSENQWQKIVDSRPKSDEIILYTIGYEGVNLEEYINKLIINDIKVLCDVRKNPISMKFGFSKSQLSKSCDGVGIKYVHIPELGIDSEKRQDLISQTDYDSLFELYRSEVLTQTRKYQERLFNLLMENGRIALTCFESNINHCHRKQLADAITRNFDFKYQLKHI